MCELCNGLKDIQRAYIITDANEKFAGHVCIECRKGRELCYECNFLKPLHSLDCASK